MVTKKVLRRKKIKNGIRTKISGTNERPRISVFKSNKAIYAQVINDELGKTLATASSTEIDKSKNATVSISKEVGLKLAEKAKANGCSEVIFDRSGYIYHGVVKALADGLREGGLKF
jgi:large subunit ribosomal protein L18